MDNVLKQLSSKIGQTVEIDNKQWTLQEILLSSKQIVLSNKSDEILQATAYGDAKRYVADTMTMHIYDANQQITEEIRALFNITTSS